MLREKYLKEVIPAMRELFGYKNNLAVPRLEKVVVNIGLNHALVEKNPKYSQGVQESIMKITGQRPVKTLARKSIAGFKIRKGIAVGMRVTLRGNKMYDFIEKLINISLPRTRDFRGLSKESVDERGNLSIGFKEQTVFPEIRPEILESVHPLEVTITTTARNKEEGMELLKLLGFPFAHSV